MLLVAEKQSVDALAQHLVERRAERIRENGKALSGVFWASSAQLEWLLRPLLVDELHDLCPKTHAESEELLFQASKVFADRSLTAAELRPVMDQLCGNITVNGRVTEYLIELRERIVGW